MKKNKDTSNVFEIVMSKDHLGQSLQEYLRTFGYFRDPNHNYFKLQSVETQPDGNLYIKGVMEDA